MAITRTSRAWRPAFDFILEAAGREQEIVAVIRNYDARIVTSAESGRVRVEVLPVKIDLRVEDTPPMDFPDLERTKVVIQLVQALEIPMRIEMGTHPAL